jgi:hypothetical protein
MSRRSRWVFATLAASGMALPRAGFAQTPDHAHDHAAGDHSHASAAVDCTTLAKPPWMGLPESDLGQIARAQQTVMQLNTPEAARAAGFNPALGDIPGMGVHYVNSERTRAGVNVNEPDHLLFATIDGKEQLVGMAYAFVDVVDTKVPIPFESELAHWHDHPQFAGPGQTLHMLHVWFIPSSNGPFAGLNFWLPFRTAGITPPSACWMANEEDSNLIQVVSFALVPSGTGILGGRGAAPAVSPERTAARQQLLTALDAAAKADDRDSWVAAANRFVADLTQAERAMVEARLRTLTMAQMSSAERDAAQDSPGSR